VATRKINTFLIFILKIKYQPLNASPSIIIRLNITKFNGHNRMIFQDHGHSSTYIHEITWNGINKYHHGILIIFMITIKWPKHQVKIDRIIILSLRHIQLIFQSWIES